VLVILALRTIEAALELIRDHPSIHWDGAPVMYDAFAEATKAIT